MFVHIVCWKVKEEAEGLDKAAILSKMKSMLEALPAKINIINDFEVGKDIIQSERSYDLSLYSSFDNQESFKTYQTHPETINTL